MANETISKEFEALSLQGQQRKTQFGHLAPAARLFDPKTHATTADVLAGNEIAKRLLRSQKLAVTCVFAVDQLPVRKQAVKALAVALLRVVGEAPEKLLPADEALRVPEWLAPGVAG